MSFFKSQLRYEYTFPNYVSFYPQVIDIHNIDQSSVVMFHPQIFHFLILANLLSNHIKFQIIQSAVMLHAQALVILMYPIRCHITFSLASSHALTGFIQARLCKIQGFIKDFSKTFLLFSRTENLRKILIYMLNLYF